MTQDVTLKDIRTEKENVMDIDRMELVLGTIDRLGVVTVKQLHEILKFSNYRKTCRIVQSLEQYLNVDRSKQKIVYLNKEGRNFLGSENEVKKSPLFDHMLLCNLVFIYYNCPISWHREYVVEFEQNRPVLNFIKVEGINVSNKQKFVSDAYFERNGYSYFIEVDNKRDMKDNKKKINKYIELWPKIRERFQNPRLCVFTHSDKRKKMFLDWTKNIPNEVKVFSEI